MGSIMPPGRLLPRDAYTRDDVCAIARELLGQWLETRVDGCLTAGIIVETEAYAGPDDRASHAFGNRRTSRTEPMFAQGGIAYVYRCYGIHALFNVVTGPVGLPHAVLIRAIEPVRGIATMLQRRGRAACDRRLTAGPGSLTRALGIDVCHTGVPLRGPAIRIRTGRPPPRPAAIIASPRVGIAYAGPDADRPWRYRLRDCPWTSPAL